MNDLMKKAKMKAIIDIMSQMDDMDLERLMPKSEDMSTSEDDINPDKKGITIMKIQSSKTPEIEMEDDSEDDGMSEDDSEKIDPYSNLARLKARLRKGM